MKFLLAICLVGLFGGVQSSLQGTFLCGICTKEATLIQKYGVDNLGQVESEMDTYCNDIPFLAQECKNYVGEVMPDIARELQNNNGDVKAACQSLGYCQSTKPIKQAKQAPFVPPPTYIKPIKEVDLNWCSICEQVISTLGEFAYASEDQIIHELDKVCGNYGALSSLCMDAMSLFVQDLVNALNDPTKRDHACTEVELCPWPPTVFQLQKIAAKQKAKPKPKPFVPPPNYIKPIKEVDLNWCSICEELISTLGEFAFASEQQIIDELDKVCGNYGALTSLCKDAMSLVVQDLVNAMNDPATEAQACTAVELCPWPPTALQFLKYRNTALGKKKI